MKPREKIVRKPKKKSADIIKDAMIKDLEATGASAEEMAAAVEASDLTGGLMSIDEWIDQTLAAKGYIQAQEHREELAGAIGSHAFRLWESDIKTFDPAVKEDLVQEAKLKAEYIELMASAKIEIDGKTVNLSGLQPYITHQDRELRYEAVTKRWDFFKEHQERFDGIYAELTALRTKMSTALGFENYVGLGYARMQRVDYNAKDVARFRKQVVEDLVPLCVELREKQREALGVEKLMYWDEAVHSKIGNPKPQGDGAWMVEQARTMFSEMNPELGDFFNMMADKGYLDLETRDGKAGGGFCTSWG